MSRSALRPSATIAAIALVSAASATADFIAYNDFCGPVATVLPNVSHIQNGVPYSAGGAPTPTTGQLVNYADGAPTGVTLSVVQSGTSNGLVTINGGLAPAGTEMATIFNNIVNLSGIIDYSGATGPATLTWSGLNPEMQYEVVIAAMRGGTTTSYDERTTVFRIVDADSFNNTSSAATTISQTVMANDTTRFVTGTVHGNVLRYANIRPGADGDFSIVAGAVSGTYPVSGETNQFYVANAMRLTETAVPEPAALAVLGMAGLLLGRRRGVVAG